MLDRRPSRRILAVSLILSIASAVAYAGSEFMAEPSWQPPTADAVHARLEEYLQSAHLPSTRQTEVRDQWAATKSNDSEANLLDRLAQCLAKADGRVAGLIEFCSTASKQGQKLPEFSWLADSETPLLIRSNMRVYLARWLVQEGHYDEAIAWTDGLDTDDVVAPEVLLFYRAIAFHQLVEPTKAGSTLAQLQQRQESLPTRYQKLADLMHHDLSGLQDDSLDHISRRMNDIHRRLAQGQPGEHAQKVENGVIESLDKLIKKAEDQAQKQAQAAASKSGGNPQPSAPMQDSQIAELKAPGKVDHKDIGHGTNWGNMNDKDREKAMQEIGREFPSHYREVIEEYFRRLAAEEASDKP
ncbi:MAG TPA: hypothetical protein VHU84_17555 [Lacipirellulaceae bacterium]|nr:hypothetical protein [Lacipirellulaceae bacterium]